MMSGASHFSNADIATFLDKIERSGVLGQSKRRLRLLEHLIRAEVDGEGAHLKAYSIGLDIFGKPAEFDPSSDSVVRVEMGRLRTALQLYEASEFATSKLSIEIPIGTYRPVITVRDAVHEDSPERQAKPEDDAESLKVNRPRFDTKYFAVIVSIVVLIGGISIAWFNQSLFKPIAAPAIGVQLGEIEGDPKDVSEYRTALTTALARSNIIQLFEGDSLGSFRSDVRFLIEADIFVSRRRHHVATKLREVDSGRIVWADMLDIPSGGEIITSVESRLSRELRVQLYGASKLILEQQDPKDLSPEALFVLSTFVPGVAQSAIDWEKQRISYAEMALEVDPNYGAAHSVLAEKLSYLANVYGPADTPENRAAAMYHARRAMNLSPSDPDVVFNVAFTLWHSGQVRESVHTMKRVVEIDPSHDLARYLNLVSGYTCSVASDEVIEQAIAFDRALPADNPIRWVTLGWIGGMHANRQEWNEAIIAEEAAARVFQGPYTLMRRAMILNEMGRTESSLKLINEQVDNWPGFDPNHFIDTTIPRICSESETSDVVVEPFLRLGALIGAGAN